MVTRQTWAPPEFRDKSDVPFLLALRFKLRAASTSRLASGDSPVRNCQSLVVVGITIVNSLHGSEGSCREEPVAVVVVATVDECSEKLGGGLGRQNLNGKLVRKTEHQRGLVSTITKTL